MKKRRVLALLLALSMVMGMNGVTVLAAEPVVSGISVVDEEGDAEITEIESPTDEQETNDSEEADDADGQDESEIPGGEDASDNSEDDSAGEDSENNDTESPDAGAEDDALGGEEDDVTSEDDTQGPEGIEGESDEDAPTDEEVSEDTEVVAGVRMMTFTDDTGMKITYDAVQATAFTPDISEEGVLTGVEDAEGVVDLRQETTITSVGERAFQDNAKITYVMLPKTVQSIGESAFDGCTALKGISIPSRLTSVGDSAFKGCISLTQLALPNSVTSIGTSAFENDSRLFMVHMVSAEYSKLETIGDSAFKGCSALEFFCSDEEYSLPGSIKTIGASAFANCYLIDKVTMSDNVTALGENAYQNCSGIKEVTLSSGIETISKYTFDSCIGLEKITFGNANITVSTKIDGYAFSNCTSLSNVELPDQINYVCTNAFYKCTALRRIEIDNTRAVLDPKAFPDENAKDGMCLVGKKGSTAQLYADGVNIRFVATDDVEGVEYYTYKANITGEGTDTNPKVTVKVTTNATYSTTDKDINQIDNGANANKGVKAGTDCYFYYELNGLTGIQLVSGSVKCNGVPIKYANNSYSFKMPIGGATITAEFERSAAQVVVDGDDESIEGRLSSEVNYDANTKTGYLKVGQSAKFYLTNSRSGAENRIPTSKIEYGISPYSEPNVVSIDASGTVKALKEGTAVVTATVKTKAEEDVIKTLTIIVEKVGINHISMSVLNSDSYMTVIEEDGKITGLSIPTERINKDYTFDLKAVAFSDETDSEEMAIAFTWTTSDSKVAKLAKTSTTAASSVNTVTIPKNTDGEATITVTATDENQNKITQKFVVSAQSYQPRLTANKITINPNQLDFTTKLEIISAYGKNIDGNVTIVDAKDGVDYKAFELQYEGNKDSDSVSVYGLKANVAQDGTYSVLVRVTVMNTRYEIPLTIVVKKSIPNPTVAFAKNQPKINLFYGNDGTEVETVVSKLGTDTISQYSLEALTEPGNKNYDNDKLFEENFEIDQKGVIRQKSPSMLMNSSNKPVVTGYLVLRFNNYKSSVTKKYKITIPTQTTAVSYALNKTSGTYNEFCDAQIIELQLLDKKNKNTPVDLYDKGYTVTPIDGSGKTRSVTKAEITDNGKIRLYMDAKPIAGKVYLQLKNTSWAGDKSFTYVYTIKTSSANPTLTLTDGTESLTTLKSSTITINPSYKEQTMRFGLKSNQEDTVIAEKQVFEAQSTDKNKDQYAKLSVTYENGIGKVSIKEGGEDIANGTYTFVCQAPQCKTGSLPLDVKKVTLKIKIARSVPTVTAKGSLNFNRLIKNGEKFIEKAELALTVKNLPEEYAIDSDETTKSITCTTKNREGYEKYFKWEITGEGNLQASMQSDCSDGTYKFSMEPVFTNNAQDTSLNSVTAKKLSFSVKVYHGNPTVSLSAKGKLNLLDRSEQCTTANSIVYTPTIKNLKDTVQEAKVYDADGPVTKYEDEVSKLFEVIVSSDGKLYVTPIEGVVLENNKTYKVDIWVKLTNYVFDSEKDGGGIFINKTLSIKTAQILPKVTTDKSEVNLYLSNKDYVATFIVDKKDEKSIGAIESITFGEKDAKAQESFVTSMDPITGEKIVIDSEPLDDGSLKVNLKLKNGVAYGCNTTNKITMYVRFKGQGNNTAGTAISMKVKINK